MEAWVFENLDQVSDSWHSGGGLVVVASSVERAREMVVENDASIEVPNWDEAIVLRLDDDEPERIWVFPDAGCC